MSRFFEQQDAEQTKCGALTQQFRRVQAIHTQMLKQKDAFLASPHNREVPNTQDLAAGFENDLIEYREGYDIYARNLVNEYLTQFNTGPWAVNERVEVDETDGRIHFTGEFDLRDPTIGYFPALIKTIDGRADLGEGIKEVPYLEKTTGFEAYAQDTFSANRLRETTNIIIHAQKVSLNELKTAWQARFYATSVILPELETMQAILIMNRVPSGILELPRVISLSSINAESITNLKLPRLRSVERIHAPSAKNIIAPELEIIQDFLNIANLDSNLLFRSQFNHLRQVGKDEFGVSIYVKDTQRKAEIESLHGHGLEYGGEIGIVISD